MIRGLNLWTLIGFLGAAQALVVGAALLTARDLQRKVFGLLLLHLGTVMGVILYSHLQPGREPLIAGLIESAVSMMAPVLLYAFVVVVAQRPWTAKSLGHGFLPALWILHGIVLALMGKIDVIWHPPIAVIVTFQMAYTLYSAWITVTVPKEASVSPPALLWARSTVGFMALIHLAQILRFFVNTGYLRDIVPITSAMVVFALTFLAARQSFLINISTIQGSFASTQPDSASPVPEEPPPKYRSSSLTDERAERGLARFQKAMETDRAFLRPDLTLDCLAEELRLARTYLSQVINERCHKPFLEVLADYRVQEAARILADEGANHQTVEAIGEQAGFQSKSAFYSSFKKRKGVTPAAFRRGLRETTLEIKAPTLRQPVD